MLGIIFGGVILSYIDLVVVVEVCCHIFHCLVIVVMCEVVFYWFVFLGDFVFFYMCLVCIGIMSIMVHVDVRVECNGIIEEIGVIDVEVVYVVVDEMGKKIFVDF